VSTQWGLNENTLYYTLSTIAQALAGAFAVLAAFVLFRLPAVDRAIQEGKHLLRYHDDVVPYVKSWAALKESGWKGVDQLFRIIPGWHHPPGMRQTCEAAFEAYRAWPDMTTEIRSALSVTAGDIGFCLVALAFTPIIAKASLFGWAVLAVAVGAALVSLWLYRRLILAVLRRSE